MNNEVRDYAASNLRGVIVKTSENLSDLAEYVIHHLGLNEDDNTTKEEVMEIISEYVDTSLWEDEELENEEPAPENEDDDIWTDPAGGTHYGNEGNPAAKYESESAKTWTKAEFDEEVSKLYKDMKSNGYTLADCKKEVKKVMRDNNITIKKSMNENLNNPSNSESKMARIQLKNILNNTRQILNKIQDCQELEAWVQSYLTKADDYLEAVRKTLIYGQDETTIIEPIPVKTEEPMPLKSEPIVPSIEDFEVPDEYELPAEVVPDDIMEPEDEEPGEEIDLDDEPFDLQMPKKEEEDEVTFADIDFMNQEEDMENKLDQEEIQGDFSDIDNEVKGEDEEDEDEDEEDIDESLLEMTINNYPWFVKKIDNTHFFMSDKKDSFKDGNAWPYHIGEHKGRSYYNDLNEWLNGGPSHKGKKYSNS